MNLRAWLGARLSPDSRLGEGARRVYRRLSPRVARAWTEVLHGLAASRETVYFVQIGSNDAGYADPLRYHILNNGWRGLMIEPLPHIYVRLVARYRDVPGLAFENVAIDAESGERPFYHLRPSDEPGLPPWYEMLGSFYKDNVLKHKVFLEDIPERIVETKVRCATFDQVCVEHAIERFDLLHIDAEGYDYEILRTVALQSYRPAVVLYESKHLSSDAYRASLEQLHRVGYLTHSDIVDTIAVRQDALVAQGPLNRGWRFLRARAGADADAIHSGRREAESGV